MSLASKSKRSEQTGLRATNNFTNGIDAKLSLNSLGGGDPFAVRV